MDNEYESSVAGVESDGQSSRATAGGGEDLRRFSMDPGLGSVRESQEDVLPSSHFYPSESLGAAVRRRADREAQEEGDRPNVDTPRTVPASLVPGSTSGTSLPPALTSTSSSLWRQSPRVESVSQRAAANLEQQGQNQASAAPRWPDLAESFAAPETTNTPRRSRIRDPEQAHRDNDDERQDDGGDGDTSRERGIWPKFLRF